jgi:Bacterial Ig-like domain (group 2)
MMKQFWWLVLSSFTTLALVACPGDSSDPNAIVSVNLTGITTLEVGQGATLNATALNSNNAPVATTFTWSSSNSSVLVVEANTGKVTAKQTGTAIIEAKANDAKQSAGSSSLNVTMTLRLNTQAYGTEPVTIFISNADGSLAQSKTVLSTDGFQRLEFPGVSSDSLVTAAYKYISGDSVWNGTAYVFQSVTHYRLTTYPASSIKQNGAFYFGGGNNYLGNLTAQIAKPNIASVTSVGGTNFHWCCTYDLGAKTNLTLNDGLYRTDLQSDDKYSPVLFAYDNNKHIKAYAPYLDQIYDPTNRDKTFTIAATDWKTDLSAVNFVINNVTNNSGYYCSSIRGYRKNIAINPTSSPCDGLNYTGTTLSIGPREYAPSLYDQLEYGTGYILGGTTKPGDPESDSYLVRRVSSIPSTITLNALTDFLPVIENLTVTNPASGRPVLQWNAIANASSTQNVGAQIFDRSNLTSYDYYWDVNELPNTKTAFTFPELPTTLADFAPKEGTLGHKYQAGVYYDLQSSDNTLRQTSSSYLNFDPAAVRSTNRQKDVISVQARLEKSDRFAIQLKQ